MPDLTAAAKAIAVAQWVIAIAGLAMLAAWFLAPALQTLRRSPSLLPKWDTGTLDTLVLALTVLVSVFCGLVAAGQLVGFLHLPAVSTWVNILSVLGFQGTAVASVVGMSQLRRLAGRPLPAGGRNPAAPLADRILFGAATFCSVIPLAYGGSFAAQKAMETLGLPMHQQELTNLFTNAESPLHLYCLTFMAVVVAPLGEEVIFRAGLFRILLRFAPRWAALLISGSVFAASHANTMHLLPLTILGIVFALAYERTGSLVVPVVAHGLFNLNTITMLLAGLAGSP